MKRGEKKQLMLAYMKAYEGRFREAAMLFQSSGNEQKTLEMFTDLRMFDQAQVVNHKALITMRILEHAYDLFLFK